MAQPLQTINLVAPAFKGINTEDSPLAQDPSFAEVADNAVIDKRGRIAARQGFNLSTISSSPIGSDRIHHIHHFYDSQANEVVFSVGNNKIFSGTDTLTDRTPASYTITSNNWKIVNFNDYCYFFQRDYEPLVYSNTLNAVTKMSAVSGSSVTSAQYCHEAIAAFGRLWVVGTGTNNSTIYWSDLLIGHNFSTGSSGSIDVSKARPDGFDEIRAIAAHNNLLIIFGNHSILVYQNANSPANMSLVDTVAGIGAVCRNSVQHIGTDVLFMSPSGLRSFGRTIQEKSMPITDLSRNIKTELVDAIQARQEPTVSVFSPENYFYLIGFPDQEIVYCFDLRARLENGSYRATRWPSSTFKAFERKKDGTLLIGTANGIGTYSGYTDNSQSYRFRYYSPGLTFGDPSKLKILKKVRPTFVGGSGLSVSVYWSYDFEESYASRALLLESEGTYYYGTDEYVGYSALNGYGISSTGTGTAVDPVIVNKYLGEFASAPTTGSGGGGILDGDSYFNTVDNATYVSISSVWTDLNDLTVTSFSEYAAGVTTSRRVFNGTGSGTVVSIGVEADINNASLSIQEINVYALMGKTL